MKILALILLLFPVSVIAMDGKPGKISPPRTLTTAQAEVAAANYKKYCALCHGEEREGYVNDHAPSLRSKTLFESGVPHAVLRALSYGRDGTAMGGYLDEIGGPMTLDETWDLTYWLFWQSGADRVRLTTKPVQGNAELGGAIYKKLCTDCHGKDGEGVTAPALGNQTALSHNKDEFLRYAITYGRDGTEMASFKDKLSVEDIDNVTAFLRSKANGWTAEPVVLSALPTPDEYIINPESDDPEFNLSDGLYVSSKALSAALKEKKRMVLLDTRVTSVWQRAHIEGSFPMPYYSDFDAIAEKLPKDVQIVGYCSCPRAAADNVVRKLRRRGYTRTAVLYEGIFGWINLGYPVKRAEIIY